MNVREKLLDQKLAPIINFSARLFDSEFDLFGALGRTFIDRGGGGTEKKI